MVFAGHMITRHTRLVLVSLFDDLPPEPRVPAEVSHVSHLQIKFRTRRIVQILYSLLQTHERKWNLKGLIYLDRFLDEKKYIESGCGADIAK